MTGILEAGAGKKAFEWIKKHADQVLQYGKRVATLEERVAALEVKLSKQPADACLKCGELAMRVHHTWNIRGTPPNQWRQDEWKCEKCGHEETRIVYFKK